MTLFLNHNGFEDYLVRRTETKDMGGVQYLFRFNNYYGASVIKNRYSYGSDKDLWELAVVNFRDGNDKYVIDYYTPITNDIKGYLTDEEVVECLNKIKDLHWD